MVRVDATTLHFEATYPVPKGDVPAAENIYRGLVYGGGSLWVGGLEVPRLDARKYATVIQVDPQSGEQRATGSGATALAWAETSGDLWASNFGEGTLTRLDASTRAVETVKVLGPYAAAAHILVDRETVWVGDWDHPRVERLRAVGPRRSRLVELPVRNFGTGVWQIAAGEGYIWATTPGDAALWRIDPKTNKVKRMPIPYPPIGVTANEGDVWVTVRRTCIPGC